MTANPTAPSSRSPAPLDQVSKRILGALTTPGALDAAAIASRVGASEAVVRQRLAALQEAGVLRGLAPRIDPAALGQAYEVLVSGVPTTGTDRPAIERLCAAAGVTRVFGMASRHSVAFTVRGDAPAQAQDRGLDLARAAGLVQAQAVLIVNTFHDQGAALWPEAGATPA
ncbi:MAG TPA: Lrp/AsnC family transcriptional regulator [Candidatus Thermoplasmatota archaeon]|nr:Lrp/AsnC family transcriptional regulator [Candidatus Thermoplasmatota archaeon]